jgi:hypothetical protein
MEVKVPTDSVTIVTKEGHRIKIEDFAVRLRIILTKKDKTPETIYSGKNKVEE